MSPAGWIPLSVPDVTDVERDQVAEAVLMVSGGRVIQSAIDAFEAETAAATGTANALALSSGTAALHLGLIHLGARPGTVVLTSSMTFAATANAIRYTGAEPVFIDSRRDDANVNVDLLLHAADELRTEGRGTSWRQFQWICSDGVWTTPPWNRGWRIAAFPSFAMPQNPWVPATLGDLRGRSAPPVRSRSTPTRS